MDEPGKVTLSALQPQTAVALTATHSDPDGTWHIRPQVAVGQSRQQGTALDADIDKATADAYTPVDGDIGSYLRATASYTDKEGSGKSAMAVSEYAVQAVRGGNTAPAFADDQDPVTDRVTRHEMPRLEQVAENTKAGQAIGNPVVARRPMKTATC